MTAFTKALRAAWREFLREWKRQRRLQQFINSPDHWV